MLPVVVRVENLETKATAQYVFRRSPVHIGRNKLNEVPLTQGFVSLWHGILRFGENSLEYLDLDSTNGTEVDGHRLRRNVFVPVTEKTDLRIGSLRLHFSRREVVATEPKDDQTLFGRTISSQGTAARSPASQPVGTVGFKPALRRTPISPATAGVLPEEQSPEAVADWYRETWQTLHAQLTGKLAPLSADKRERTLQLLRQRFPALEQEEEFRALGEAVPVDGGPSPTRVTDLIPQGAPPSATAGFVRPVDQAGASPSLLRIFAQTYGSESAELRTAEEVEQFLQQLAAVLEAFAKAFLELRRGHDQFGKEVAVPLVGDQTLLRHAKTPRDLLCCLLDCEGDGAERIRALNEGFADVMIHEVALLNGIRQGIGALLTHLSPEELQRSMVPSPNGAGSMLLRVWPVRAMALWRAYVARHRGLLQEEKEVHSIIFGSEFAFAYAQIVGGNVKSPPREAGPTHGSGRRADG